MNHRKVRAAWREPMLWLAAGLPAAVLVAAGWTIALASAAGADAGEAGVRHIAQLQLQELAPDRTAAQLRLRAEIGVDAARGEVVLRLENAPPAIEVLQLTMRHPVRADGDRFIELHREGDTWRGRSAPWPPAQAWELRLLDARGQWRVGGRLAAGATHAWLRAGVAE